MFALLLATAILSSAARRPFASVAASLFAQKCTKKSRGCSSSIWLWMATTSIPFSRKALIIGFSSSVVTTASDCGLAIARRLEIDRSAGPHGCWCGYSILSNRFFPRNEELVHAAFPWLQTFDLTDPYRDWTTARRLESSFQYFRGNAPKPKQSHHALTQARTVLADHDGRVLRPGTC